MKGVILEKNRPLSFFSRLYWKSFSSRKDLHYTTSRLIIEKKRYNPTYIGK